MRRRDFLAGTGQLTIAAVGMQVYRALGAEPAEFGAGAAFEPWRDWQSDAEHGPLALVRAAILAANAFNTQPWLFRVSAARIELWADFERHLGGFDPYLRELHISLGCALENLALAAGALGYRARIAMDPGPLEAAPPAQLRQRVATIDLGRGGRNRNDLYAAIPHRHTNRNLFDAARPVPDAFVRRLQRETAGFREVRVFALTSDEARRQSAALIADTTKSLAEVPAARSGPASWLRRSAEEYAARRDGVFGGGNAGAARPPTTEEALQAARLFGIVAVRDRYDRRQSLLAGRIWQRSHLIATAAGLSARPANAAVEFMDQDRLAGRSRTAEQLAAITGDASWQPTFMFYMGYAAGSPASARRAVDEVLLPG